MSTFYVKTLQGLTFLSSECILPWPHINDNRIGCLVLACVLRVWEVECSISGRDKHKTYYLTFATSPLCTRLAIRSKSKDLPGKVQCLSVDSYLVY